MWRVWATVCTVWKVWGTWLSVSTIPPNVWLTVPTLMASEPHSSHTMETVGHTMGSVRTLCVPVVSCSLNAHAKLCIPASNSAFHLLTTTLLAHLWQLFALHAYHMPARYLLLTIRTRGNLLPAFNSASLVHTRRYHWAACGSNLRRKPTMCAPVVSCSLYAQGVLEDRWQSYKNCVLVCSDPEAAYSKGNLVVCVRVISQIQIRMAPP